MSTLEYILIGLGTLVCCTLAYFMNKYPDKVMSLWLKINSTSKKIDVKKTDDILENSGALDKANEILKDLKGKKK